MDLEKIEIRKIFFKKSGFRSSKTLSFYYNVIPIFSKPFAGRFVNYRKDEEVFWKKMERPKTLNLSKKKSIWKKKIGDHLELMALAFISGWSPIFLTPRNSSFCPLF